MAQTQYRANLAAKDFTFVAESWGRTVIMKQFDQNFSRQIVSAADPDKDIGIPQIYYCHNVMPSSQGFQSVSLDNLVPAVINSNSFSQIIQYTAAEQIKGYLGFVRVGDGFDIYNLNALGDTTWAFVAHVTSLADDPKKYPITYGNAQGVNYFYIPYTGAYTWTGTVWTPVTLIGLTATDVRGITDSFGYLIAWTNEAIAWSSTISPTDFTPSLITGAGGGAVEGLQGDVVHCQHHVYGFVVFSTTNAVASVYSGNARYPFNFRALVGSGGLTNPNNLGIDPDTGNLMAYTTRGLQLLSTTQAVNIHPELVNFIGGSRFEDFDETTNTLIETDLPQGTMGKGLAIIANRYLVFSYGLTQDNTLTTNYFFTHALIYDVTMKRWGKIKLQHVQCFEFAFEKVDVQARNSLAFVDKNGNIFRVNFSYYNGGVGILLLGKYQHVRNRLITLQEVDVEGIHSADAAALYLMPTLDGKTFLPAQRLTPIPESVYPAPIYKCRVTGMNLTLLFKGGFNLNSILLNYTPNGRR